MLLVWLLSNEEFDTVAQEYANTFPDDIQADQPINSKALA